MKINYLTVSVETELELQKVPENEAESSGMFFLS